MRVAKGVPRWCENSCCFVLALLYNGTQAGNAAPEGRALEGRALETNREGA
jgi:hypothetical protein